MHNTGTRRILFAPMTVITIFLSLLACFVPSVLVSGTAYAATEKTAPAQVSNTPFPRVHPRSRFIGTYKPHVVFNCELPTAVNRCFGPADFYKAYNLFPLLRAGFTGRGQTIVIIDSSQSPTIGHDLHLFDTAFGLPDPQLTITAPNGVGAYDPDAATELTLDVELAHAFAPEAAINLVLTRDFTLAGVYSVTKYAVDHNLGSVISQSFGAFETCALDYVRAIHPVFQNAASKGITVFASSGDNGAASIICDNNGNPTSIGRGVQTPESDPAITSVGGTALYVDNQGRYVNETTWNDSNFALPFRTNDATGGGFSAFFARPSYQNGVQGIGGARGVPDIALDADGEKSAALVVCSSCGFGADAVFGVGGTSASAPEWSGMIAVADQLAGRRLGFINNGLYTIGRCSLSVNTCAGAFHDVVVGSNTYDYKDANGNPAQVLGYSASKGWDPTTGWGSVDATNFLPLLVAAITR